MTAKTLGAIGSLLVGIFLDQTGKWLWLSFYVPVQIFAGGPFILIVYSFIADNSTARERMIRLGFLGFVWDISYTVSLPLGAWFFNSGSYVCVFGVSLLLYVTASLLALVRLWGFKEKINSADLTLKDLISPRHVTDSLKATFKKRPGHRHIYLLCLGLVMIILCIAVDGEMYVQFMYTKRMFQWQMDRYSYFSMIQTLANNFGTLLFLPLFHHFNVNDNIIIIASGVSGITSRLLKAFSKSEDAFFASTALSILLYLFYAPVRAEMTRCIPSEDLGKVFAVLASLQSIFPIITSLLFTSLYNATSELNYPWQGSFFFASIGFTLLGSLITFIIYLSLGFKQMKSYEEEQEEKSLRRQNSNHHPDDRKAKDTELICLAFRRHGKYE